MDRKQKRDGLLQEANAIVAGAKAAGRNMTADEASTVKGKIDEVKALNIEIEQAEASDQLASELAGFGTPGPETSGNIYKAKSLGDHFIHTVQTKGHSLKTPGTIAASEIPLFKAATDTHVVGGHTGAYGPLVTEIDKDFVFPKRDTPVIADLMQSGLMSGNAITYPVYGALEGGTDMVSEGGQKPQMHVSDPTWRTDALSEAAGWFKLTDDMAEDLAYVVSEINTTALYDLSMKEEAQLLNGNGTSPQLQGLLNRSGVQLYSTPTGGSDADAIFHAMTLTEQGSGFSADGIVINPADYEKLRLAKDANDQYYGGGFFQGAYGSGSMMVNPPIWGRRTVVTTAVTAGTVLVGAFKTAKVFRKGGIRVESTNSHEDDFTNDKITVRVRERLALQVKYPAAFVRVTLAA